MYTSTTRIHILALAALLFVAVMMCGCASASNPKDNSMRQTVLSEPLVEPDLSDAMSLYHAGSQRIKMVMYNDLPKDGEQTREYVKQSIDFLETALKSRAELEPHEAFDALYLLFRASVKAGSVFADEPEYCHDVYLKAIQSIDSALSDDSPYTSYKGDMNYCLSKLYFLAGEEEKAFYAADCAWLYGYRNLDDDMRSRLKDCMELKNMKPQYLPPPKPRPTLLGKLLFPVNVVPDMLCDAVCFLGIGIYSVGGLLVSDEPGWAFPALCYLPCMPVMGCIIGVDDAWRGFPFWKTTPFRGEEL